MTVSAERPTPRADCTAGDDGGIGFDLDHCGPETRTSELLLRRRGGNGSSRDTLRLPLSPLGGGRLRAVLPGATVLAEGRWDVHVCEPGADDGAKTAVEPGIRDARLLMDRTPETGRITVRIPYPTADGRLAVRCWVRSPHAEAGPLTFDGSRMTVEGTLYGTRLGDDACVEARLAGAPDRVCRVPVVGRGGTFAFTLPFDRMRSGPVTEQQLWTLWLVPATGTGDPADGVRVSRILDDVWDRRNSFVYLARSAGDGARAIPCYSSDNDLCVRLVPDPAPAR